MANKSWKHLGGYIYSSFLLLHIIQISEAMYCVLYIYLTAEVTLQLQPVSEKKIIVLLFLLQERSESFFYHWLKLIAVQIKPQVSISAPRLSLME